MLNPKDENFNFSYLSCSSLISPNISSNMSSKVTIPEADDICPTTTKVDFDFLISFNKEEAKVFSLVYNPLSTKSFIFWLSI